MSFLLGFFSVALIATVLWDAFEAMVLPRRVTRQYRLARFYYRGVWRVWRWIGGQIRRSKVRQSFLSVFGPLSLLGLFGLWIAVLIFGFGLLHWSLGSPLRSDEPRPGLATYLYISGVTFFTVGYSDITPVGSLARFLSVLEAGIGLGFLAIVIGYMPAIYQAFSRREVPISLLDARAGSPPTAGQVLIRLGQSNHVASIDPALAEWERWAAELLESHLSFQVLSYYRSQHDNQSWLAALSAVLDTCSLLIAGVKGADPYQAQLTFAMARHAVVDLALVFKTPPRPPEPDRLPPEELLQLRAAVREAGVEIREGRDIDEKLAELRGMYEPFIESLARYFSLSVPPFLPKQATVDNWQTSAWTRRTVGIGMLSVAEKRGEHFT
jgi:hypothetical protein